MALTAIAADGWRGTYGSPPTFAPDTAPETFPIGRVGYDGAALPISFTEYGVFTRRESGIFPNHATLTASGVAFNTFIFALDTVAGVTNNSTKVSPVPVAQWAAPDRLTIGNSIGGLDSPVEVLPGHLGARNAAMIAAVKFVITDGTTTINVVVNTPTVSARAGDFSALAVYALPATDITALNAGLIRVDAKVYPWLGGTASVLDSSTKTARAEFSTRWYRKDVARAANPPIAHVKTGGNDATGIWSTNDATAQASPFATADGAIAAANHATRGTPATGGLVDGAHVRVGYGTGGGGSHVLPSRSTALAFQQISRVTIEADPSATLTLGAVRFRPFLSTGLASGVTTQAVRIRGRVQRTGANGFFGEASAPLDLDLEDVVLDPNGNTGSLLLGNNSATRAYGLTATAPVGGTFAAAAGGRWQLRGVVVDLNDFGVESWHLLACHFTKADGAVAFASRSSDGSIVYGNRFTNPKGNNPVIGFGASAGTTTGFLIAQNVVEYTRATNVAMVRITADSAAGFIVHPIIVHNTIIGANLYARSNVLYDDGPTRRTSDLQLFVGNIHVQLNTKAHRFVGLNNNGSPDTVNAPLCVGNLPYDYGVNCRGEFAQYVDASGGGAGSDYINSTFRQLYPGMGAKIGTSPTVPLDPLFTDPRGVTFNGTSYTVGAGAGAGGGVYTLQAGSPAIGMIAAGWAVLSHDSLGFARRNDGAGAGGAYEMRDASIGAAGSLAVGAGVTAGVARGAATTSSVASGVAVDAGAMRGAAIVAQANIAAVVSQTAPPTGNAWSIRFTATVTVGEAGGTATLVAAATARAAATASLAVGNRFAAAAIAAAYATASLQRGGQLGADAVAVATCVASLLIGDLLLAEAQAFATSEARLATGIRFAAAAGAAPSWFADLETHVDVFASVAIAAASIADLSIGKLLGAAARARPAVVARLQVRKSFPFEGDVAADRPRANRDEALDALIWRVTGMTSIEAVLAANPGLADLGPLLPEGHPVDLPDLTDAGPRVLELVQLWD